MSCVQERHPRGAAAAAALAAVGVLYAGGCQGPADPMQKKRNDMVERQIAARGIRDPRVLEAMRTVPRHLFVPPAEEASAYDDRPLPIGSGQTISQPYVVAFMAEQLRLTGKEKVLEIGTGSGYSTAILASLAARVYSIEIRPELAHEAKERLAKLGVKNVELKAAATRRKASCPCGSCRSWVRPRARRPRPATLGPRDERRDGAHESLGPPRTRAHKGARRVADALGLARCGDGG